MRTPLAFTNAVYCKLSFGKLFLPHFILCSNFPSPAQFWRIDFQFFYNVFFQLCLFPIALPIDLWKDVGWHFADQPWVNKWGFGQAGHIFIWERQRFVQIRSTDFFRQASHIFIWERQRLFRSDQKICFRQASHIFISERQRFVWIRLRDSVWTSKPYIHQGDLFLILEIHFSWRVRRTVLY